jgi:hypothetical protein
VVIKLSGRQRMLTQKMSKEMLLIYLGVEPDENRPILEQQDYSDAQILRVAELNLPLLKEMNTAVKMYEVLSDSN